MDIFASDKFYQIQTIEEFYFGLTKRRYWKQIRPEILHQILLNSNKGIERFKEFVIVSEHHDCVKRNFLELQKIYPDYRDALSAFSLTMLRLGSAQFKNYQILQTETEQEEALTFSGIAYWSAIICDPFQFAAYNDLGWLYLSIGLKNRAVEMCEMYEEAEQMLRSADGASLSRSNKIQREKENLAEMRNIVNHLKNELGLQHEELKELKEKGFCTICNKNVEPTFHGLCPVCATVLLGI